MLRFKKKIIIVLCDWNQSIKWDPDSNLSSAMESHSWSPTTLPLFSLPHRGDFGERENRRREPYMCCFELLNQTMKYKVKNLLCVLLPSVCFWYMPIKLQWTSLQAFWQIRTECLEDIALERAQNNVKCSAGIHRS